MSCGYNAPAKTITIISTPVMPGVISGPATVCPGGTYAFSIAAVAGAVSYNWSTNVPGALFAGTGTSRNITFPAVIPAGSTVSVTATGSCGTSASRVKNIATGLSSVPGSITGPTIGQCGQLGVSYTILPVGGASGYLWTANNGATVSGPNNLTGVSIDFPAAFGTSTISVISINSCGNSAPQTLVVTGAPGQPGIISGNQAVCAGNVETYTTPGSTGASSFSWTLPSGSIILGVATGPSINVLWGNTSGNVSVSATNACGTSSPRTLAVSIVCRASQVAATSLLNASLYPNPTYGSTTLKFEASRAGHVSLSIIDVAGRVLSKEEINATEGVNVHELDLSNFAKGLYLVRLEKAGEPQQLLKVTVE
jgi:hypothetical protein